MKSADGKMYLTDVADQQQLFRLIERMKGKEARKALTDEWKRTGVKDSQYATHKKYYYGTGNIVNEG